MRSFGLLIIGGVLVYGCAPARSAPKIAPAPKFADLVGEWEKQGAATEFLVTLQADSTMLIPKIGTWTTPRSMGPGQPIKLKARWRLAGDTLLVSNIVLTTGSTRLPAQVVKNLGDLNRRAKFNGDSLVLTKLTGGGDQTYKRVKKSTS